jgi:hypothetical protein
MEGKIIASAVGTFRISKIERSTQNMGGDSGW